MSYADGTGYTFASVGYNRISEVDDFSGRVVERHQYDVYGRGVLSELANGVERRTLSYSEDNTVVTDALGNVTTYNWGVFGGMRHVTQITGPCAGCSGGGGQLQKWAFDAVGRVDTYTDGAGKQTKYTYYPDNNVWTITDPLNNQTTFTYDAQGRMLTKAGPDGSLVTYVQGPAGPTSITEKVSATQDRTTGITYKPFGKPWTITDPRTKMTTLGYNSFGDLTSVTDPLTHQTTFGYDAMGRRTTVTDALTHTTTTAYDARGRVTRITNHDLTHSDFAYDTSGRRTRVTDPQGRATSYLYDTYGRLEKVVDPLGGTTTYGYDAMSNLTSLTDAAGHMTQFHYDGYNRVDTVTYPAISGLTASEGFTYDAAGRLATKTDRRGVVTTYSYYDDGRLWKKEYSGGTPPVTDPPVVFTYDAAGHLKTAANGTDTLTWTYDLAGQLLTEQSVKNASTVGYTYDLAGNRIELKLDGTLFVTYGYDDASRLTTITRGALVPCPSASSFCFGYDNANRRTSMTYPNGVATSYSYDNLNRLTNLAATLNGTTPVTNFTYTYDNAGNRLTKQQLDYSETYGYDALYRLTSVSRPGPTSPSQWAYGYDAVGNRTTEQVDGSVLASTYDERNELLARASGGTLHVKGTLSEPGTATVNGVPARMSAANTFDADVPAASGPNTLSVVGRDVTGNSTAANYSVALTGAGGTYTYDANGNLATKVEGTGAWTYTFDAENRLTKVEQNSVEVGVYKYDPLGRRVEKTAGPVSTNYTHDHEDILRQSTSGNTPVYLHGPGIDEPLATETVGGLVTYYHSELLGTLAKATNAAGSAVSTLGFDAWGKVQRDLPSPYGFTGREHDSETGLVFLRARYYDPNNGRFVGEDPLRFIAGVNFYMYVGNRPTTWTDPDGLQPMGWGMTFTLSCMASFAMYTEGVARETIPPSWAQAHCLASCLIKQNCGGTPAAKAAEYGKEFQDVAVCTLSVAGAMLGVATRRDSTCESAFQGSDFQHNREGRSCPAQINCNDWCKPLRNRREGPPGFMGGFGT